MAFQAGPPGAQISGDLSSTPLSAIPQGYKQGIDIQNARADLQLRQQQMEQQKAASQFEKMKYEVALGDNIMGKVRWISQLPNGKAKAAQIAGLEELMSSAGRSLSPQARAVLEDQNLQPNLLEVWSAYDQADPAQQVELSRAFPQVLGSEDAFLKVATDIMNKKSDQKKAEVQAAATLGIKREQLKQQMEERQRDRDFREGMAKDQRSFLEGMAGMKISAAEIAAKKKAEQRAAEKRDGSVLSFKDDFRQDTKEPRTALDQVAVIQNAYNNRKNAPAFTGNTAIRAFARAIDPNTGVREEEARMLAKMGGEVPERFMRALDKIWNGVVLTESDWGSLMKVSYAMGADAEQKIDMVKRNLEPELAERGIEGWRVWGREPYRMRGSGKARAAAPGGAAPAAGPGGAPAARGGMSEFPGPSGMTKAQVEMVRKWASSMGTAAAIKKASDALGRKLMPPEIMLIRQQGGQ